MKERIWINHLSSEIVKNAVLLVAGLSFFSSAFEDVDHDWKHTARYVWEEVWEVVSSLARTSGGDRDRVFNKNMRAHRAMHAWHARRDLFG